MPTDSSGVKKTRSGTPEKNHIRDSDTVLDGNKAVFNALLRRVFPDTAKASGRGTSGRARLRPASINDVCGVLSNRCSSTTS